jgi:hypothetical protein
VTASPDAVATIAVPRTSSAGRKVLVVGSYPPVPTAGAEITSAMMKALWAEGAEPEVAAPRSSAARLTVAVSGPLAGRRLGHLKEVTGADDLVLCAERDLPFPTTGLPALLLPVFQRLTVGPLIRAMDTFDHVTLIACGDLGAPPALWAELIFAADVVIDRSDALGAPGVTTLGPPETTPQGLVARARGVAPRVLGRRLPQARRLTARWQVLRRRARAILP